MNTTPHTTASGAADLPEALRLADAFESFTKSSHRWTDGQPIHIAAAVELRRLHALAASAPVAPTREAEAVRWEFRWLNPANNPCSSPSEMAWKLVEPKGMQPLEATLSDLRAYRYAGNPCYEVRPLFAEAAPVAPAPQPAPVKIVRDFRWDSAQQHHVPTLLLWFEPVPANSPIDAKGWNDRDDVAIMLAAAPKADQIEDGLAMVPAPLQQGEYPETLYEGGRESIDDALAVVESFGPGVQGLNDTFARQVLLGQEVRRLRAAYEQACQGRNDFRNLYRASRGAAQAAPAPVAEDAEDAANWKWLAAYLVGPRTDRDDEIVASESVNALRKLVSAARAQAAEPKGGANANR